MFRLVVGAGLHYEYLRTASSIWVWDWLLAAPIMPICHQSAMPSLTRRVMLVGPEFGPDVMGKPAQAKNKNRTQLN